MKSYSRRWFLRGAGAGVSGLLLAACQRTDESPLADATATPEPHSVAPTPVRIVPTDMPGSARPYGIEPVVPITPNEDFYSVDYTGGAWPDIDPAAWRLEITGLVDKPLSLSFADLKALPAVIQMRTLECIGNPVGGNLISNAVWKGARLKDVLERAGVGSQAIELKIEGADGYSTSIPIELGLHPDSLLVYEMNEAPIPRKNGFPVRCLFPGKYGQKQPKWVTRIELIDQPYLGHWERQGWSNNAAVRINSRIDHPGKGDHVTQGQPFEIGGIAFANGTGVQRMEVAAGKDNWADADLIRGPSNYVWVVWTYKWTPIEAGIASIRARGTDGSGITQTRDPEQAILGGTKPDGTANMPVVSANVIRSNG